MPEPISLTVHEIQRGVQLLLEHHRRCGLTHVPSFVDESLTQLFVSAIVQEKTVADVKREAIASHEHVGMNTSVQSQPASEVKSQPRGSSAERQLESVQSEIITPSSSITSVNETVADGRSACWSLPVLSLDERQSQLEKIDAQVKACRLCTDIVQYRQQTVFGDGTLQPKICFFGEAPGADEDREGKPFVGKAGQLLNKIIEAMSFKRSDVYILNALKCRPPQNRTPVPDEIDNCHAYVAAQLEILQPSFIVCLGAVAVRSLLGTTDSIGRLRGKFHQYRSARVVVTYHPAYLLRNESAKKFVWEDMQMLMREMGLAPSKPGQ